MGDESFRMVDESELVDFLCVEPVEAEEGYLRFDVSDLYGIGVSFSVDRFERSIQTSLSIAGTHVATVSHEGAEYLGIDGDVLRGICEYGGIRTTLTLRVRPRIEVLWSSLVIR